MEIGHIVTGVISALVAIILVLGAMLKFYLPRLKKNNPHNPGNHEELVEMRRGIQALNASMRLHNEISSRDHDDVMGALQRMESKLK